MTRKALRAIATSVILMLPMPAVAADSLSCYFRKKAQGANVQYTLPSSNRVPGHAFVKELYSFADVEQWNSGSVVDASLTIDGKSYPCTLWADKILARCGNWFFQNEVNAGWSGYDGVPNYPYIFKVAFDESNADKPYLLADAYVFNSHFPYFDNTYRTPKSPPVSRCVARKILTADTSRKFSEIPAEEYSNGRFVCIQSVACSADQSITTLSVSFYLLDTKYEPSLRAMFDDDSANRDAKRYKLLLAKINPLLGRPDIKVATFTIRLSQKYYPYKPLM